ncbi:MAG: YqaA family protein [Myxococcaceae bacterium]
MSDTAAPVTADAPRPSWYRRLYKRVESYADTKYALIAFIVVSFLDASIFPIPPFALMVPMVLAKPKSWWKLAIIGTLASFGGGIVGYWLGSGVHGMLEMLHLDLNAPLGGKVAELLHISGQSVGQLLGTNFWVLALMASILPTPFKLVSIGSGVVAVPFARFLLAAAIGRSVRFAVVGGALWLFGAGAKKWLRL